jgi:succinoglycan biosynthesis transport protein ExoP
LTQVKVDAANAKLASLMQQRKLLQDKISKFAHAVDQDPGAAEGQTERFSLLEPPILPDKPFKPNRMKILAMGFFFALALSGGTVAALESIDKRIRGSEALGNVLGSRPLVTIPYLSTRAEEVRRRRMLKGALVAAVITLIAGMVAVQLLIMPLDVLFAKILARLP